MGKTHHPGAHLAPTALLALLLGTTVSPQAASVRCDLVSQDRCMDISTLNGATIRVPPATTRLTTEGLNLCGIPGSVPEPTDIVYIMDQSTSMRPRMILPGAEDTSGWFECNNSVKNPAIKYVDTIDFHGNTVAVAAPTTTAADMRAVCKIAGDPYSVRLSTIQNAIEFQAAKSPQSYASVVSFHGAINGAQMTMTQLSSRANIDKLKSAIPLSASSGTNYEAPLTWARIQLYGGQSGKTATANNVVAPSPDSNKVIILISDGEPNTGTWQNALRATNSVEWNGKNWTTTSTRIPPVYTIFLGIGTPGAALTAVAKQTGGEYYQIPPYMPDSLTQVIQEILGKVIKPARPDSLFVSNLTNGQSAKSVSSKASGNSFQMGLDSLVALEPGNNTLSVKVTQGSTTLSANWTVVVADTSATFPKGALDTVLGTRCGPGTSITIKPDNSGLAWADTVDRNLLLSLNTSPAGTGVLPLSLITQRSKDAEQIGISVPVGTNPNALKTFSGTIPWADLTWGTSVPGDLILRSGSGWDSARVFFQMPRDRRDTASAVIGLHRPRTPVLSMTPRVEGPGGRIDVSVIDSEMVATNLTVTIKHRLGDSLRVRLTKGADGIFRGSFPFVQGAAPATRDTILQMGVAMPDLDSISGKYLGQSATTYVDMPKARLRFVDALGEPRDTVSVLLALGGKTRITVKAFVGDEPCTGCGGWVRLTPSDLGISLYSVTGTRIDSVRLTGGSATVEVRAAAPVKAGSIAFVSDSLGSRIVAQPVRIAPNGPDSAVYFDDDGDGSLDRVEVHLGMPWSETNSLRLPWPDASTMLDFLTADRSMSVDGKVVNLSFAGVAPLTTASKAALSGQWRYDESWEWMSMPVVERIAPVPVRAVLRRGASFDTLRVRASESLWPAVSPINRLVSKLEWDGRFAALSPRQARVDGTTGELLLIFPSDSTDFQVQPGDSVRFANAGAVRDSLGNVPGEYARMVMVEGLDRAPLASFIYDTDADGRADRIVLRLRSPLTVTDRVGFRWPSASGGMDSRELPLAAALTDSGDRVLVFDVDPFAFGKTSCPSEGCQNLGWFATTRFQDAGTVEFAIQDKIDPIILEAKFKFSDDGTTPDSLQVRFSEPVKALANGPWLAWGRPGDDSLGEAISPTGAPRLLDRGMGALLLLDSTFPARLGDSVRIHAKPAGALSDTVANAPQRLAYWAPLAFGQPPLFIQTQVPTPVVIDRGWNIPANQPPVTILIRKDPHSEWTTLTGEKPLQPIGQYSGLTLNLNRIPEGGGLYVYDLLGVAVVKKDLSELLPAAQAGVIQRTRRGDYEIFLAWDGCDMKGNKVATGIYLARVYGWAVEENRRSMINVVKKLGIRRELPSTMRVYE